MKKLLALVAGLMTLPLIHARLEAQERSQESERETSRIEFEKPLEIRGGKEEAPEPREPGGPGEGPGRRGEAGVERTREAPGSSASPTQPSASGGSPPDNVHGIPAKRVAGVSVTEIAGQAYPSGHVVAAVLAVDLATSELIVANSWQKDEAGRPLYEGYIVQTKDITYKNYGEATPVYYVFEVAEK